MMSKRLFNLRLRSPVHAKMQQHQVFALTATMASLLISQRTSPQRNTMLSSMSELGSGPWCWSMRSEVRWQSSPMVRCMHAGPPSPLRAELSLLISDKLAMHEAARRLGAFSRTWQCTPQKDDCLRPLCTLLHLPARGQRLSPLHLEVWCGEPSR